MNQLLFLLIFAPLCYGVLLWQIKQEHALWVMSLLGSVTMLVGSVAMFWLGEGWVITLPLFTATGISFSPSAFSLFYSALTCGMWVVSIMASREYFLANGKQLHRYYASLFLTLSGCLGMFYAYDLVTLFLFFEIMSFSSYLWVMHQQDEEAISASNLYLTFSVAGGLSVLLGIFLLSPLVPSLALDSLEIVDESLLGRAETAGFFMFLGFGAKAGAFFLHDWSPVAYTAAPAPATALLSSVLSKTGVYGLIILVLKILPNSNLFTTNLLFLSLLTMLFGAFCALLSGNLKRTLAFSSISQVGFILWGVCLTNLLESHNTYAAYGTIFHMVNHSLIKILFFCLAGVVFQSTNTLTLTDLKGFGRGKPWFQGLFTVAALCLAGFPLGSGYVSKTLLHEAMVEYIHDFDPPYTYHFYEWMFLLAGGFTVAYMLKLYVCFFVETGTWQQKEYATKKNMVSLSVVAGVLLCLGLAPNLFFGELGAFTAHFFHSHEVETIAYFTWTNLKGALISLTIGGILFKILTKVSKMRESDLYDEWLSPQDTFVEILYKPYVWLLSLLMGVFFRVFDVGIDTLLQRSSQRNFKALTIPETFYYGDEHQEKHKPYDVRITQSLAFSLLMFGLGFIFTVVYLLVVGGTITLN